MAQGYAIELYFDPALENQVLKAWNVLARRQISTQLIEIESRPHITLFSSPFVDPSKLETIVKTLALKQEALPLSLSSIGTLPNEKNVLFLSPTPSIPLLQFHLQLCEAMKKEGIEIGDEYKPDYWIPFCPVAENVPKNRMGEAFTVLRELKLPVDGYAMDIGLVEFSPVRELFSFMLGNTIDGSAVVGGAAGDVCVIFNVGEVDVGCGMMLAPLLSLLPFSQFTDVGSVCICRDLSCINYKSVPVSCIVLEK